MLLASLVSIVPLSACSANPRHVDSTERYLCNNDRHLTVTRSDKAALVLFEGRNYKLTARPGSLGERYGGTGAYLVIDDDFAAFVADQEYGPSRCTLQR